jgi:hypothetical protein
MFERYISRWLRETEMGRSFLDRFNDLTFDQTIDLVYGFVGIKFCNPPKPPIAPICRARNN